MSPLTAGQLAPLFHFPGVLLLLSSSARVHRPGAFLVRVLRVGGELKRRRRDHGAEVRESPKPHSAPFVFCLPACLRRRRRSFPSGAQLGQRSRTSAGARRRWQKGDDELTVPRFGASSLHQRDSRSALFEGYTGDPSKTRRTTTASPAANGYGYGYGYGYSGNGGGGADGVGGGSRPGSGFRPATPNRRGQYSDAVLNELESQNDAQVAGILGKVKTLKDVRVLPLLLLPPSPFPPPP